MGRCSAHRRRLEDAGASPNCGRVVVNLQVIDTNPHTIELRRCQCENCAAVMGLRCEIREIAAFIREEMPRRPRGRAYSSGRCRAWGFVRTKDALLVWLWQGRTMTDVKESGAMRDRLSTLTQAWFSDRPAE